MTRIVLVLLALLPLKAFSAALVDAVEPSHSCERLIDSNQKQNCQKITKRQTMDSYLAATCEKQSDDKFFMDCISLADQMHFDPRKLQKCGSDEMEDQARIDCLKVTGTPWKIGKSDREPATVGTRKSKSMKKKKKKNHKPRANQRSSRIPPDQ